MFKVVKSNWKDRNESEKKGDRKEDGKSGFKRNVPDLMIRQFGFLGFFEVYQLTIGEKMAMVFGAGKNGKVSRDSFILHFN